MLPRGMDRLLAPHHPSHVAEPPEWMKKGVACIGTAKPVEIGWLMCIPTERVVTSR